MRLFVGLYAVNIDNADVQTTAGNRNIMLRYSTSASDTGFKPLTWDGTTQTLGTVMGTIATGAEFLIELALAVGGASAVWTVTPAGGTAVTQTQTIGAACLIGNNANNKFVPFGHHCINPPGTETKTIDNAGVWCDYAGRND